MKSPAPAEMQRWSEDVARDPASLAFLPLAKAYRRMGKRDAALRLVLRGLERHSTHVEAHGLLALLYLDAGDRGKAADEWGMVLRLEPENFDALRGMGFHYLEQGDVGNARRHLQHALEQRPNDPAVREAFAMLRTAVDTPPAPVQRDAPVDPWASPDPWVGESVFANQPPAGVQTAGPVTPDEPWAAAPVGADPWSIAEPLPTDLPNSARPAAAPSASVPAPAPARAPEHAGGQRDPSRVFDVLLKDAPFLGALILDQHGQLLAGTLASRDGSEEALGAILGGAIDEAARTAGHLSLGAWKGILLESEGAVVHLSPLSQGLIVLVAARRDAPTGWVLRTAARAAQLAAQFVGEEP
jgi:tetratricopeptide (TPR) repeat protein